MAQLMEAKWREFREGNPFTKKRREEEEKRRAEESKKKEDDGMSKKDKKKEEKKKQKQAEESRRRAKEHGRLIQKLTFCESGNWIGYIQLWMAVKLELKIVPRHLMIIGSWIFTPQKAFTK